MNEQDAANAVPPWAAGTAERMHELDPQLNAEEIELLQAHGSVRTFAAGERLWTAGDRAPMMLVLEGQIDVVRNTDEGEAVVISHGPGHYVGEIITMTGGRALVSGRAAKALTALVIESTDLRRFIATEAELGEKLLLSFILRRMRMIAENLGNVVLVGNPQRAATAELQNFLSRNGIPFTVTNPRETDARALISRHELNEDDLPAVIVNDTVHKRPSIRMLADTLGFTAEIDHGVTYDLAVIGSGPAGLASAVSAASEGLSVLVLEQCAPGGQAGSSSRIENYVGFPTGISGQALMGRAYLQAQKFGAHIAIARELLSMECGEPCHRLRMDGGDQVLAKVVVIASGAIYRQPSIGNLGRYGGVHYGASHVEAQLCRGRDVAIIGGGNSAGQAAVYLSRRARHVHVLVRGGGLGASMSDYLVRRIDHIPNIYLHTHSEVEAIQGDEAMESVTVHNNRDDSTSTLAVSHLFIFIGAQPGTAFVGDQVALDDKGFVLTGDALSDEALTAHGWSLNRRPHLLETSCPRVFAAGDVRSGSVKRVASAVGEGSVCVQFIHTLLNELAESGKAAR